MFMTACCVALACWIAILILTLPSRYTASHWQVAWVGLDIAELAGFAGTAWAAWHQRQVVIFFMITTGTLLVCDAWFDLMTAGPDDVWISVVTALGIEVPLAILLIRGAVRIMRLTMMRLWLLDPRMRLWHLPLFP